MPSWDQSRRANWLTWFSSTADPATHISDIRHVKTVVKDGVVFQVADLDRAGVIPAK